ncbi:hypothetical protein LJC59_08365 [Desulfovibrio sp. OttesenSCG-928-A18]|nr:hypothetical protein [Desulfovibrio sp. OttesenSCG-928-A18]
MPHMVPTRLPLSPLPASARLTAGLARALVALCLCLAPVLLPACNGDQASPPGPAAGTEHGRGAALEGGPDAKERLERTPTDAPALLAVPGRNVHVFVALCDNVHQGIVPVPASLGDGSDPAGNLYWGAMYGVKSFMRKQPEWALLGSVAKPSPHVLERLVFRHKASGIHLVADAYRGSAIKQCLQDFLQALSGGMPLELRLDGARIEAGSNAGLICYVGHNGLMEFSLPPLPLAPGLQGRGAAIFACQSKYYFSEHMREAKAEAVILSNGNMAPEAYVLNALALAWARGENARDMREAVAKAYHTYQKCGLNAARRLFAP